ncbi:shikimate dehydrogenase family protein [Pedobacter hiemivivus]|uniref:Shikimate dehydrogenase n=1 Tax=Pedobacter hiemivivus TaxID=2530454 RepID=A0A4R0MIW4_9SPHI|nr:shikimate dehydrogenase [Pedobacter hiemivivus]TCC86538.1 shikimate dehydrogenase [Pedobacter hiemivivus]
MRKFGLIGYPLSHSFSKKFFGDKFREEQIADCEYELYPIPEIGLFSNLITEDRALCGINVTIPYKVQVLPFLNEMDEASTEIGAVNCISIKRTEDGQWLKGYNTDAYGFEESLKPLLEPYHQKALIFGDGGAAKAVKYVLNKLNISFLVVTRKPAEGCILYDAVDEKLLQEHTVLINTTPLGMSPNANTYPDIPYACLTEKHVAYDLVYNPAETIFLKEVRERGGKTKNGLEMLHLQAIRSWEIWNL